MYINYVDYAFSGVWIKLKITENKRFVGCMPTNSAFRFETCL